jgi:hypothetical protein
VRYGFRQTLINLFNRFQRIRGNFMHVPAEIFRNIAAAGRGRNASAFSSARHSHQQAGARVLIRSPRPIARRSAPSEPLSPSSFQTMAFWERNSAPKILIGVTSLGDRSDRRHARVHFGTAGMGYIGRAHCRWRRDCRHDGAAVHRRTLFMPTGEGSHYEGPGGPRRLKTRATTELADATLFTTTPALFKGEHARRL